MNDKKNRILIIAFIVIFVVLGLRLAELQLLEGRRYRKIANENAAKIVPAPAARGIIFDRNKKVIVENRPIFSVQIMPHILSDVDVKKREAVMARLGQILGEKVDWRAPSDSPIIIKDKIDRTTAFKIEEQKKELEGVTVTVRPVRFYPYENLASHLLGYVGEIESDELKRLKSEGYHRGDWVGKDGVEKEYDREIRGVDGGKKIEVDVYGLPTRLLEYSEPVPGANVTLTIDLDLQQAAEKALGNKEGAVVILEPKSGEILALVSHPNYDPNIFIDVMDKAQWAALSRARHPFMNRAFAIYPPGSIFKVVTLSAALQEKVVSAGETFYCPGYYRINNRIAKCWKAGGHGKITAKEGLTQSCDVVFYELGRRLGPDRIAKYAKSYGLGEKTGVDLPQEKKGLVPTEEWKRKARHEPWYEGDSINYGIGQGFVQVTPLQMAVVYSTVATGKRMKPFAVKEIKRDNGEVLYLGQPEEMGRAPVTQEIIQTIREALEAVVERATGRAAKVEGFPAAGKTGTAENPGLPHAWFLCYAPCGQPAITIAVFVAHGQHGDQAAAYVARDILTWYRDNRLGTEESF